MTQERQKDEPFLNRAGAIGATSVITGIVGIMLLAAYNAPEKINQESGKRDAEHDRQIRELTKEVAELRKEFGEHRVDASSELKRLAIQVESGTNSRFTAADWEREDRRLQERHETVRRDIKRLNEQAAGIVSYLTTERRYQEQKRD